MLMNQRVEADLIHTMRDAGVGRDELFLEYLRVIRLILRRAFCPREFNDSREELVEDSECLRKIRDCFILQDEEDIADRLYDGCFRFSRDRRRVQRAEEHSQHVELRDERAFDGSREVSDRADTRFEEINFILFVSESVLDKRPSFLEVTREVTLHTPSKRVENVHPIGVHVLHELEVVHYQMEHSLALSVAQVRQNHQQARLEVEEGR